MFSVSYFSKYILRTFFKLNFNVGEFDPKLALHNCPGRIQKCVDDLNLHSYSNLSVWVRKLDERVEEKLAARLEAGLAAWNQVK